LSPTRFHQIITNTYVLFFAYDFIDTIVVLEQGTYLRYVYNFLRVFKLFVFFGRT